MNGRRLLLPTILTLAAAGAPALAASGAAHSRALAPRAAVATGCTRGYPARRDPSNPLALRRAPGADDPLRGARFFVAGPRTGEAAGAIATLIGSSPARYSSSVSWARFAASLRRGAVARRLARDRGTAHRVDLLAKIAAQPAAVRFSRYSAGGGPGAVLRQVRKFICGTLRADPGSVPLIDTYFLSHSGCPSAAQSIAEHPLIDRWSRELAEGIGRHPAVLFLELDAVGASGCLHGASLAARMANLRLLVQRTTALPHTVVYIEGGYSDAMAPGPTAARLRQAGVAMAQGFFTNDTHYQWTASEVAWGERVARLLGGAHFVVNTAGNGRGPKLNPDPVRQGVEALCNPPGRGLGPRPTARTGFRFVDAFLWTATPGRSAGPCGQGYGPPGSFDVRWALTLAAHANQQLGLRYASRAY